MPTPVSETSIAALAADGTGAPPLEAAGSRHRDADVAAAGDGIGGVGDQVQHDALERPGVAADPHGPARRHDLEPRRRRHQRREARRQARHELREVEALERRPAAPAPP